MDHAKRAFGSVSNIRWMLVLGLMAGAWYVGAASSGSRAMAQDENGAADAMASEIASAIANGHLSLQDIVVDRNVPPIAVLPSKDAVAIVGAADGRYYFVDCNGLATPIRGDRRFDLYWRSDLAGDKVDRVIIVP